MDLRRLFECLISVMSRTSLLLCWCLATQIGLESSTYAVVTILDTAPKTETALAIDKQFEYVNPMNGLSGPCFSDTQVEFFKVSRKLAPVIYHEYIGARVTYACNQDHQTNSIYGANKGIRDLEFFSAALTNRDVANQSLKSLVVLRGECASVAFAKAVAISKHWQQRIDNKLFLISRTIATPLFGQICSVVTNEITAALASCEL